MNRVSYIYHQGRQILFLDFTDCSVDEALGIIQEAGPIIREQHENSVLTLTDVTGARYNQEVTQAMKEFAKGNKPFVKAGAVVGLDGMKKIIYNVIAKVSGRNLSTFDNIEEAKEWLVGQWRASSEGSH